MAEGFSLNVLDAEIVAKQEEEKVKTTDAESEKLREQAEQNALAIWNTNIQSLPEKKQITGSMEQFGLGTMELSTKKNALLKTQIGKLSEMGQGGDSVSKDLMNLNREIKDLDPSLVDFTKKGILGKIFNPIRDYFARYEKSETVIAGILTSLAKGKTTLQQDNTTLALEQQSLRELSQKLTKEVELGMEMDRVIEAKLAEVETQPDVDPDRIKFVKEEILFPLRQRIMDMQQVIAVNHQGAISMEIIQGNNRELIRGIQRAETTTVSALRTAVTIAAALYNQKIVLEKIQILNETTNNMIARTAAMLREQGSAVQQQAATSAVTVDTLKQAFADTMAAMNEIADFRQKALPAMQQTISAFKELADEGESQLQRIEKGRAAMNPTA